MNDVHFLVIGTMAAAFGQAAHYFCAEKPVAKYGITKGLALTTAVAAATFCGSLVFGAVCGLIGNEAPPPTSFKTAAMSGILLGSYFASGFAKNKLHEQIAQSPDALQPEEPESQRIASQTRNYYTP